MADKKFADFVYDLMDAIPKVNGNPMLSVTSMTDDNARYREDPFYRSREIQARDQATLDELLRQKRLEEEARARQQLPSSGFFF